MKKKYSEEETVTEEPAAMKYNGTGDYIKIGDEQIELYPGDKIADTGPTLVFYSGPMGDKSKKLGVVRPVVDGDELVKFKGMDKTREVSTGIWIYE